LRDKGLASDVGTLYGDPADVHRASYRSGHAAGQGERLRGEEVLPNVATSDREDRTPDDVFEYLLELALMGAMVPVQYLVVGFSELDLVPLRRTPYQCSGGVRRPGPRPSRPVDR
jgi:hypothetical protein